MKNKTRLFVFSALVFFSPAARAVQYCTDFNNCFFSPWMALYSQNDPVLASNAYGVNLLPLGPSNSLLCAPTSAGMAWHGVWLGSQSGVRPGSFSATNISGKPFAWRIISLTRDLGTNLYSGGTFPYYSTTAPYLMRQDVGMGRIARLGSDFNSGVGYTTPQFPYVDTWYYQQALYYRYGTTFTWGWYYPRVENRFGRNYVTYVRNGGHVVATNGTSNGWFYIYNPWYAMREWYYMTFRYSGYYPDYTSTLPAAMYRITQMARTPIESAVNYPLTYGVTRLLENHNLIWAW